MEVGASQLPTAKPSRGTLRGGPGPPGLAYGAITLYGGAFQPTSATRGRPGAPGEPGAAAAATTPHLPAVVPRGFGLGSPPFGRPYSGDPCWFLFLPLLRCFRSGGSHSVLPRGNPRGFPSARGYSPRAGGPIRGSRVPRLPAPTPGISPLAAPFVGARAEPSTGRRTCRRAHPGAGSTGPVRPPRGGRPRPTRASSGA